MSVYIPPQARVTGEFPVIVNGASTRLKTGATFADTAALLAALDAAGVTYTTPDPTTGPATGRIKVAGTGAWFPVGVNGAITYFPLNTYFTPSAAQLEVLQHKGICYTTEYSGITNEAETIALIARMTSAPTAGRTTLIDNFIKALKTGATSGTNIFAKLDALWMLAAADTQAASLDWTGHFDLVEAGIITAGGVTFTADQGWSTTDISKSIATGITLGTSTLGCSQTSFHMGGFALGDGTRRMIGSPGNNFVGNGAVGAAASLRIISGLSAVQTPAISAPRHHVGVRTGASQTAYGNGAAGTTNSASGAFSGTIQVGNSDGTNGMAVPLAMAHLGSALTAAEVLDLYNAAHVYLQAVAGIA